MSRFAHLLIPHRPEPDVNTDEGFAQVLAQTVGSELSTEQRERLVEDESPDVQRGLEEERDIGTPPQRDDQGRFAREEADRQAEEAAAASADEEDEPPAEPPADDDVASLRKQLEDAQSQIGRLGNEVGEKRALEERLARLEAQIETRQEPTEPPPLPGADEDTVEALEGMVEQGGARAMLVWVANNRDDLMDAALDIAAESDPVFAARFGARYESYKAQEEMLAEREAAAPQTPEKDPLIENLRLVEHMKGVVAEASTLLTQRGVPETAVTEHLQPAFAEAPDIVKQAVLSPDAGTRAQGVNVLAELVRGRVIAAATTRTQEGHTAAATERKRAAQVATGSQRSVPARQPGEEPTLEERRARIEKFHQDLLEAPSTSVADGLTYGK